MGWLFGRRKPSPTSTGDTEADIPFAVGGDRIVFWKTKEQVDGVDYGPVWIADANDPNVTLEEPDLWLTWEEAEAFARKRELPIEDV